MLFRSEQALGSRAQYDMTKFLYVGNPQQENNSVVTWATSGVATVEDAKRREVTMGSTGDDPSSHYPRVMNALIGTRFKVVLGYPGANEINLAMERGELDGRGSTSVSEWKSTHADWLAQGKVNVLAQVGRARAIFLPNAPLLSELVSGEADRAVTDLLSASLAIGRQIFAAPDTPPARVAALRAAFDATMRDRKSTRLNSSH